MRPPNVLLILTDDQGWGDLGLHGNTVLETPHLDELGRTGIRFNRFYTHPVCAPTRASLLTGRHYLRTGVTHVHGGRDFLHPDEVTMADWFRANGYATGMWGKWHSGKTTGYFPWERGFDEAFMARLYEHRDGGGDLNGRPTGTPGWTTDALTDMAVDFIRRHRDRPFLAYVPHLAPHLPLVAKPDLVAKYTAKGLGVTMATAFAMVEMVDESVGRLLAELDALGLTDTTIVLFLSDNGPQYFGDDVPPADYALRSGGGLKGHKGSLWENGVRVPCLLRPPSRFASRVVDRLADVHDILPTLADLCGLTPPEGTLPMDGRSLVPLIEGATDPPPRQSVQFSNPGWPPIKGRHHPWPDWEDTEYRPVTTAERRALPFEDQLCGLITEDFKLLRHPGFAEGAPDLLDGEALIDRARDPTEDDNVAAEHPAVARLLRRTLAQWFDQIRHEPHAFHTPRFVIGGGASNVVLLYAPSRRLGHAVNRGLDSRGWIAEGDGGEYLIDVRVPGSYDVTVAFADHQGAPFPLEFRIDGNILLTGSLTRDNPRAGLLPLPPGKHTLTIQRGHTPRATRIGRLLSLDFVEHKGTSV